MCGIDTVIAQRDYFQSLRDEVAALAHHGLSPVEITRTIDAGGRYARLRERERLAANVLVILGELGHGAAADPAALLSPMAAPATHDGHDL